MSTRPRQHASAEPSVEAHLLGLVDFDRALALQHRLVYETAGRNDGQITLLVCEHLPALTVGREGSRAHVAWDARELAARALAPRFVSRGGGCLLHLPGQLAVYPIVPLDWYSWRVGDYLLRLQSGLAAALDDVAAHGHTRTSRLGVWGRAGQLAFVAAAVKNWVSYFGCYINVAPQMQLARGLVTDPQELTPASTLVQQRQGPVKMTSVREAVIRRFAEAFGTTRYHLYTGHPLMAHAAPAVDERVARVG